MVRFIPSSSWALSAGVGGNVRHPAWRSGTPWYRFHNFCSSFNFLLMTSSTKALEPIGVPNTFTPSGFHTSGPNSAIPSGTDARFQTRVLPLCNRIPACVNSFSPRLSCTVRVLLETSPEKYTSSKCEEVFLGLQFSRRLFQRVVDCQTEQQWHERVSQFASFSLDDVMHLPGFIYHALIVGSAWVARDEREEPLANCVR